LLVAFCALLMFLPAPRPAGAAIYWTDLNAGTIGRASLDGSRVGRSFIEASVNPWGITADSRHIYWSDVNRDTISRARFDGGGLVRRFVRIPDTGWWDSTPRDLEINRRHIYWTSGTAFIGRSRVNGRAVDLRWIDTDSAAVVGLAISSRHVYWTSNEPAFDPPPRIGRARLDGSRVKRQFIRSATGPGGMARHRGFIYWTNSNTNSISRARLDGTVVNRRFIRTGDGVVSAVDVAGGFIYWTDYWRGTIGRARLDGSGVRRAFIRVGSSRGGLRGITVVPQRRAPTGGRG
jgi:hypothetical protein